MKGNETIDEIRKIRREISRKFDFDPGCLVAFYKERQRKRMAAGSQHADISDQITDEG